MKAVAELRQLARCYTSRLRLPFGRHVQDAGSHAAEVATDSKLHVTVQLSASLPLSETYVRGCATQRPLSVRAAWRLRTQCRHEQQTVAVALSAATHHSAPQGEWREPNAALRGQTTASEAGKRLCLQGARAAGRSRSCMLDGSILPHFGYVPQLRADKGGADFVKYLMVGTLVEKSGYSKLPGRSPGIFLCRTWQHCSVR